MDHVTIFCGTSVSPQQANFILRIYRELNLNTNLQNSVCLTYNWMED
jgi:hypothetical protein